jgi:hypothetical protein
MSAQSVASTPPLWGLFKRALFLTLGLMFLFVLWRNERFILNHSHPDWAYYFPVRWWLIPHGLGGLIALVAGPFQFSSRLRQRHLPLHRMMGRAYLIGVAIAVPFSVYLSLTHSTLAFRFFLLKRWLLRGYSPQPSHSRRCATATSRFTVSGWCGAMPSRLRSSPLASSRRFPR